MSKTTTGPITSYAQNFEDVMLWRALGQVPNGFYIDLGAQHPVTDSVSKAFYEKGWRGIHVEATPAYAALLRLDRPDETVIEAAVNDVHGVINFFEIPATGISTGDKEVAQSHRDRGFDVNEISVPCVTLQDVFDQAGAKDIHWLKVDVESMELQVLRGWGLSSARPWVVVVESTVPLTQADNHLLWEHCLEERGYTHVYFDGLNRYYLAQGHEGLASAFVSGPNVFDGFSLHGSASATFCAGINDRHLQAQQALQEQLDAKELEARQLQEQHVAQATAHQAIESEWRHKLQTLQGERQEAEHTHTRNELARQKLASETLQQAHTLAQSHLQALVQREQAFAAKLQALHTELDAAHAQARQRGQVLQEQVNALVHQLQGEADTHSQALLQREKAVAAHFEHLQTQLASAHEQALHREQSLLDQLTAEREERQQANAETQANTQTMLQRELGFAVQLETLQTALNEAQKTAHRQTLELQTQTARAIQEAQALANSHLQNLNQRERAFAQQLAAWHSQKLDLQSQAAIRERELQTRAAKASKEADARARERELALQSKAAAELRSVHAQAQARYDALVHGHQAREATLRSDLEHLQQALARAHDDSRQQVQSLAQQEKEAAKVLHELQARQLLQQQDWTAQQKTLSHKIAQLKAAVHSLHAEAESQAQRHAQKHEEQAATNQRALAACATLEERLRAELLNEQHNCRLLSEALAEARAALAFAQATWSWRATAPLRALARVIGDEPSGARRETTVDTDLLRQPIPPADATAMHPFSQIPPTAKDMPEPSPPSVLAVPPYAESLAALLDSHGEDFIHLAYQTILRRAADPEGFAYYLGRLRAGYGKSQILDQLCSSSEGRSRGQTLPGLRELLADQRKSRHWLFGRFVKSAHSQRQLNRLEESVGALQSRMHKGNSTLEAKFSALQHAIATLQTAEKPGGAAVPVVPPEAAENLLANLDDAHLGEQAKRWMVRLQHARVAA